jgi:hopanoid biosynthesis associated RND transporter like protein HpnN
MRPDDPSRRPNAYLRCVGAIARFSIHHPSWTLALAVLTVVFSSVYASTHMRMNSDYRQLIRQNVPFRKAYEEHLKAFPQFRDMTIVVLDGESLGAVDDAQSDLAAALRKRSDVISTVYAPASGGWYEDHAFLYLSTDEIERVAARLAEAQPALAALSVDPSLRGLLDELRSGVERLGTEGEIPAGFSTIAEHVAEVARSLDEGKPQSLTWSDQLFETKGRIYRLLIVQGRQDFDETMPAERLIDTIHVEAKRLGITAASGVRMRLTGLVPLNHDELVSVLDGIYLSGALAALMLLVILGFGLRSLRVIVATLAALVLSLTTTTAWAMWSVGEFNTVSAAFSVLLIGLGVDYGIHIGLRYEEALAGGMGVKAALEDAAAHTAAPISLCALTSAIGFASFIPTEFRGLAALGVIASGGMLTSLIGGYTVMLAILALTKPRTSRIRTTGTPWRVLRSTVDRLALPIVAVTAILAGVAVYWSATRMVFDFNTLSLKDPNSDSLTAIEDLNREKIVTDYSVTVAAPSIADAEVLARRLAALDVVSKVEPPSSYVPKNQAEKLDVLEQTGYLLEPVLYPEPPGPPPTDAERVESMRRLVAAVRALPRNVEPAARHAAEDLAEALAPLLEGPHPSEQAQRLEKLVIADLPARLAWLKRAIEVEPVTFDDLPADMRDRIVAEDGRALVVVFPKGDVSDVTALDRFVKGVLAVAPNATGRPVVEAGLGKIVVGSFRTAITISVVSIFLILLVTLGRVSDSLMVLAPITLAAFFTTAFGAATGIRFNMANIVAVPLILGLGVDSGIHVFMRFREDRSLGHAIESTTSRAVTLSALTTLAAFSSLSISSHRGLSSLGILLSVSIFALLYCALLVLPAMIAVRDRFVLRRTVVSDGRAGRERRSYDESA